MNAEECVAAILALDPPPKDWRVTRILGDYRDTAQPPTNQPTEW